MSFYKITDPTERRRMFEKLAETRKNVKEQFLEDRIGKIDADESLKTFFEPVTRSQDQLKEQLSEQIKPIKEKVLAITPNQFAIPPAQQLAIQSPSADVIGPIAKQYLQKYLNRDQTDQTFGIHIDNTGVWKIGNKAIRVEGNDFLIQGERYRGTKGLWELIVKDEPSEENYDENDYQTYSTILKETSAMRRNNDPNETHPKASRSWKWANIIKPIWQNRSRNRNRPAFEGEGTNAIVIPSDPNALLERLDLLMASKQAGNTGTRNEIVSICDELLRQGIVNKKQYKNILAKL